MEKETTKDPVCQMNVDPKKAVKKTYNGKEYHFCSTTCQWAFEENPEQYIKK